MSLRCLFVTLSLLAACGEPTKAPPVNTLPTYESYRGGACIGLSAFALMSEGYNEKTCKNFLRIQSVSGCTTTAIIWGSFGHSTGCLYQYIEQALELNQPIVIEVHFSCEVCRKNGNSNAFNFLPGLSISEVSEILESNHEETRLLVFSRLDEILDVFAPYKEFIKLIISTGLESQYTLKAQANLTQMFLEHGGDFDIAWNPLDNSTAPFGVWNEQHHLDKNPYGSECIRNGDGEDISLLPGSGITIGGKPPANLSKAVDWTRRSLNGGCATLLWGASAQGLTTETTDTYNRKVNILDEEVEVWRGLINEATL